MNSAATSLPAWESLEYWGSRDDRAYEPPNHGTDLTRGAFSLIGDLDKVLESASDSLSRAQFAKAWVLRQSLTDLLRYSIEDEGVDTSDILIEAVATLRALQRSDDWLDDKLISLLTMSCRVATKAPIAVHDVILRVYDNDCDVCAVVPRQGQPLIPVSSKQYPIVPILDHSLARPDIAVRLTNSFARKLRRIRKEYGITCLCFVQKEIGPVGALPMALALGRDLNLPISFYRAGYWPQRTRFVGYTPSSSDRIGFVYDLLVTGNVLSQVARDLRVNRGWNSVAGLVLFDYDYVSDGMVAYDGGQMHIDAIAHYDQFRDRAIELHNTADPGDATPILVAGNADHGGLAGQQHSSTTTYLHRLRQFLSNVEGGVRGDDKRVNLLRIVAAIVAVVMTAIPIIMFAHALSNGVVKLSVPLVVMLLSGLIALRAARAIGRKRDWRLGEMISSNSVVWVLLLPVAFIIVAIGLYLVTLLRRDPFKSGFAGLIGLLTIMIAAEVAPSPRMEGEVSADLDLGYFRFHTESFKVQVGGAESKLGYGAVVVAMVICAIGALKGK